jgi:microsomal dipeptidase-like Zn-dependent dipeptidase
MTYFDLHCHSTGKAAMTQLEIEQCSSPVLDIIGTFDPNAVPGLLGAVAKLVAGILGKKAFENLLKLVAGNPIDSQASFRQIEGGSLVVVMLITLERAYTEIRILEAIQELSKSLLTLIHNRDIDNRKSYHDTLKERELRFLMKFNNQVEPISGKRYQIINSIQEYPNVPDLNTVYVIVGIEGGHNFYTFPQQTIQESGNNMLTALAALQQWKQDPSKPRLFYTTITHHAQNGFSNHPWALPVAFTPALESSNVGRFTPTGNGLTTWGRQFINIALHQSATEKRTLIDIKHLSTVARNQAYIHIKTHFPNTPLIASHVGVTGTSWKVRPLNNDGDVIEERPEFPDVSFVKYDLRTIRGFMRDDFNGNPQPFTFNGWSINLYDEDIIEIMASRGLIGLQLEPRILGVEGTSEERFSKVELTNEWPNLPVIKRFVGDTEQMYSFEPLPHISNKPNNTTKLHLWHFCQNIMHIVLVVTLEQQAGNPTLAGVNPWEHICIGSDYDGLITAIKPSPTAADINGLLNQQMIDTLQAMAQFLNKLHNNFGGNPIITPFDIVQKLRIQNGLNFLKQHFV